MSLLSVRPLVWRSMFDRSDSFPLVCATFELRRPRTNVRCISIFHEESKSSSRFSRWIRFTWVIRFLSSIVRFRIECRWCVWHRRVETDWRCSMNVSLRWVIQIPRERRILRVEISRVEWLTWRRRCNSSIWLVWRESWFFCFWSRLKTIDVEEIVSLLQVRTSSAVLDRVDWVEVFSPCRPIDVSTCWSFVAIHSFLSNANFETKFSGESNELIGEFYLLKLKFRLESLVFQAFDLLFQRGNRLTAVMIFRSIREFRSCFVKITF